MSNSVFIPSLSILTPLPTLQQVSGSITNTHYLHITDVDNGSFVNKYKIYKDGIFLFEVSSIATDTDLDTYITVSGTYQLTIKATNTGYFYDSPISTSITYIKNS